MMENKTQQKLRIAALSDIHIGRTTFGPFGPIFADISQNADILVLAGDLTNDGLPQEAELLAKELVSCDIPVVGVLGNHDFAAHKQDEIRTILTQGSMKMLDEAPFEFRGVGFAGIKGFCGGFEKYMLASFGEKAIQDFVLEAVNESLQLENLLENMANEKKVVAMHYSPIRQTIVGEPEEIFPFLGSSRLVEPIDNYNVSVVFHGHAHYGSPFGKTLKGIPVYNVAYPILHEKNPQKPYVIFEL